MTALRTILKHSSIYSFGILINRIAGFILLPIFARYITPTEYGIYSLFVLTIAVLEILSILGINTALIRYYYVYDGEEDRKRLISTSLITILVSGLMYSILIIAFRDVLSEAIFASANYSKYIVGIACILFFDNVFQISITLFRIKNQSTKFVLIAFLRFLTFFSITIFSLIFLNLGIDGVIFSTLIVSIIYSIISIVPLLRNMDIKFSRDMLFKLLGFGLPFVPTSLAGMIIAFSSRYMLRLLGDLSQVGIYAMGYKLAAVINMLVIIPFARAWPTNLMQIFDSDKPEKKLSKIFDYYFVILCFIALSVAIYAGDIVQLILSPKYYGCEKVVPVVALSFVFYGTYFILDSGIFITKQTKVYPVLSGIAGVINILMNLILIPRIGMMGAAYATLCSYSLLSMSTYFVSNRLYTIDYNFSKIFLAILAAGVVYALSLILVNSDWTLMVKLTVKVFLLMCFPLYLLFSEYFERGDLIRIGGLFSDYVASYENKLVTKQYQK